MGLSVPSCPSSGGLSQGELEARVHEAFEYALPLQVLAATRWRAVEDPTNPDRHTANTLQHQRQLSDPRSRWITAPNNDTLYSNAWIDLSAGPVHLTVEVQPPGRYGSVALMDAYTNHIAVLGERLDGCGPVQVTLCGPGQHCEGLPGRVIEAPGRDVWLFARSLVEGPQDLANAHAMQDRIHIEAAAALPPGGRCRPGPPTDPERFLAVVNEALQRNPPPERDRALLDRWMVLGMGAELTWDGLDEPVRAAWQQAIGPAFERVRRNGQAGRREWQGWFTAAEDIGNFGSNFPLRASVALGGLGALEPVEAMYFVRYTDDQGQALDGRSAYRLQLPLAGLPCRSFWSLTVYQPTEDGQRRLVDNPIGRYSIGNRSPGLVFDPDGALQLGLQAAPPADAGARANWLPVPEGPFQVALRCYLPGPELRSGEAALPRLLKVPATPGG